MLLYVITAVICSLGVGIFAALTVGRLLDIPYLGVIVTIVDMGVFILLAMDKKQKGKSEQGKYCTKCGQLLPEDALYCLKCGTRCPTEPASQPSVTPMEPNENIEINPRADAFKEEEPPAVEEQPAPAIKQEEKPAVKAQTERAKPDPNAPLCKWSLISLAVSLVGVALYGAMFKVKELRSLFVIVALASVVLPLIAKSKRLWDEQKGGALEILAIVVGGFNFYCIIFAMTKWPFIIAYLGWIICGVIYSRIK